MTKNLNSIVRIDSYANGYATEENPIIRIGNTSQASYRLKTSDLQKIINENSSFIKYGYIFSNTCINNCKIKLIESTKDLIGVLDLKLLQGSWFSEDDYKKTRKYIAVTKKYVENNLRNQNPIGSYIKSKLGNFKIVAVFESKGNSFFYNENTLFGAIGIIPYNSNPEVQKISNPPIMIIPKAENFNEAIDSLTLYLKRIFHLKFI